MFGGELIALVADEGGERWRWYVALALINVGNPMPQENSESRFVYMNRPIGRRYELNQALAY